MKAATDEGCLFNSQMADLKLPRNKGLLTTIKMMNEFQGVCFILRIEILTLTLQKKSNLKI